jgi:hypothetical protein
MIPTEQVIEIIAEQFSECNLDTAAATTLFQKFDCIADYAISLLDNKKYDNAKRLFLLLEEMVPHVEQVTVIAIENVLIYRLGTMIECNRKRAQLRSLLPERFREIMIKQFTLSNI